MLVRPRAIVAALALVGALVGCESRREPPPPAEAPKLDPDVALAERARDELQKRLMGRVMQAVAEHGHAEAVEVCSREATAITNAVGEELGVRIGRTSPRTRNPENEPPPWARELLVDVPTVARHARDQDGALHVIFPIFVGEPCLRCHGAEGDLAPGVKDALAARYPDDHATGYAAGDLRGWFWVEVPPR
ncbi:MAG: DUF3365 domain-containing protein [Myxococcales bacterium]|nr:DUF3365 domain-containing protein [Myxococcales bacterium]